MIFLPNSNVACFAVVMPFAWRSRCCLLAQHQERFAFLDDVGGNLGGLDRADVLHRMRRSVRNEEHFAGLDGQRRLAVELYSMAPSVT